MGIASLANALAMEHETRAPFDICRALGIIVQHHQLVDYRGYYMSALGQTYITVADDLSEGVSNFVCAHELGHHLLHKNLNRVFTDYRTYIIPGRYENEADKFAAHLLWSSPPLFDEQCLDDWEIADCLNVPVCSVNARLLELGIYY